MHPSVVRFEQGEEEGRGDLIFGSPPYLASSYPGPPVAVIEPSVMDKPQGTAQHQAGECGELHGLAGAERPQGRPRRLQGSEQRWVVRLFSDGRSVKVRARNLRPPGRPPPRPSLTACDASRTASPCRRRPPYAAPDVAPGVRALVRCAWDGSMLPGPTVPLRVAIKDSTA
ncbi:hypothetical protein THAOC_06929, partial [Thalassiosira oceanica]